MEASAGGPIPEERSATLRGRDRMPQVSTGSVTMLGPPVTNWPDPRKVIQYATGSIDLSRQHYINSILASSSASSTVTSSGIVGSVVRAAAGSSKKLKVIFTFVSRRLCYLLLQLLIPQSFEA